MATSVTAAGRPGAAADANFARRLVQWAKGHRQATAYLGIVVGVGAVLFVWNLWTTRTAERAAGARLEQARLAVDSKNFRLAASELSQLVANYRSEEHTSNSSHSQISYAVFCLKKKNKQHMNVFSSSRD